MRTITAAWSYASLLGALTSLAIGCAPPPDAPPESVAEDEAPIAFGTSDATHTAVVALLANGGGGTFTECSGSIVKVTNDVGYVLTAAHCCNMGAPTVVVAAADYQSGEQYLFGGGTPQAPSHGVVANSVWYDAAYNGFDHDFCMLQISGATGLPTLALPASASDGVADGVAIEHVGFGVTQTNPNNSGRRTGTDSITSFDALTVSYDQGGGAQTPGPCEGDSGGPALLPAGAPQDQQTIVATTSFGQTTSCGAADTGTSSRVASEIGAGKFITSYLADAPTGTQVGGSTDMCQQCANGAQTGQCASETNACGSACQQLAACLGNCPDQTCISQCEASAGTAAVDELNAFDQCICDQACPTECATQCGGQTQGCGLTSQDPTCDACLTTSCCSESQACADDSACVACLASGALSCNSNGPYVGVINCLTDNCATACGISTGPTTTTGTSSGTLATTTVSSATATTATGVGGATNASTGVGTMGDPGTGTSTAHGGTGAHGSGSAGGAGGSGDGATGESGGCTIGATGGRAAGTSRSAPFAALALGAAAAAFARRRR